MKKVELPRLSSTIRRRNAGAMAIGTLISRLSGLLRLSVVAWALGISTLSDIFNLSNNAPNTFFDLLVGGILASTIVPVMVKASSRVKKEESSEALSALITVITAALLVATLIFELVSGPIMHGYFLGNHSPTRATQLAAATNLLRLFAPQLFFYGLISLFTSLLNTHKHFAIPSYAPIANNIVAILTLVIFRVFYAHQTPIQKIQALSHGTAELWLLGIGTSLGVVLQFGVILLAMRKRNYNLRFNFDIFNSAVVDVVQLSGWTLGYVVTNQVSLFFILALADAHAAGSVSAYNNSYLFFQLPYGIAAYSVMAAIIPDLAENISHGEINHFQHSLSRGLRISVALLIPAAALYLAMGTQIVTLLLDHGAASQHGLTLTAGSLMALAIGLPGFGAYLACIQGLQAARLAKSVFWIYAIENGLTVILASLLVAKFGVFGLSLSVSIAYTGATFLALASLKRHGLAPSLKSITTSWIKILMPSIAMVVVIRFVSNHLNKATGLKLALNIGIELIFGALMFGIITFLTYTLSTLLTTRRPS